MRSMLTGKEVVQSSNLVFTHLEAAELLPNACIFQFPLRQRLGPFGTWQAGTCHIASELVLLSDSFTHK